MQSHGKPGKLSGSRNSIGSSGCGNHQTGGAKYAVATAAFDGLVDGLMQAEVVSGDDESRASGRWSWHDLSGARFYAVIPAQAGIQLGYVVRSTQNQF
jgi:hypothetical protein